MSEKRTNSPRKKILWISSLIMDIHLHKTSQIEILRALAKRGHGVCLLATYSSRREALGLQDISSCQIPLKYVPLFSNMAYDILLFLYLPLLMLRYAPDFVIVEPEPTVLSLIPIFFFPRARKPKFILDIRSTPIGVFGISGRLKELFFAIAIFVARKFFQGITIITELMKKDVCKNYNVKPEFMGVWTSGVSLSTFCSDRGSRVEMRKTFAIDDKFVILYHGVLGSLQVKRGIVETIKAIGLLKTKYPDLVLFLLGRGDLPLDRLIQESGLENMVVAKDTVSYFEVPKYVAMADIGIVPLPDLPDWRYQCPLNLLECLASEKVVVATDIPANTMILGNSKCGILASSSDPRDLAKAIAYAYENRKKLAQWGSYGRTLIDKNYSWTKVAAKLETHLLGL